LPYFAVQFVHRPSPVQQLLKITASPVLRTALYAGLLLQSFRIAAQTPPPPPFTDITEDAGIRHQFAVYEGMFGGGVCVFDLNKDGFEDLFITGGMNDDQLYINKGDGTLRNAYEGSGLELTKKFVTQGAAAADVNRDGWVDLFVTTITSKDSFPEVPRARNLLFLNNGDGTFRDATDAYGLTPLYSFSTGGSFGDFNADGWPDLYVGNYFINHEGSLTVISDATIAGAHQTAKGYLLRNEQGKSFANVYEKYGMKHRGFGFGGVFTDYDNDGDQDLVVNHDFGYKAVPSYLYKNRYPRASFKDVSKEDGMDLKINAMGAAVGDINGDGLLDYFVTNIRFNRMMVNQGPDNPFVDKAKELGMHYVSISWGANFADFDHDGDLDLFVSNGDLNPNCVPMADFYFENNGGTFTEKGRAVGLNDYGIGRGSAVFDLENDGDLDIIMVNQKPVLPGYPTASETRLFRNDAAKGNWLKIALAGRDAESNGLGSRVTVVAGGKRMIREIDGGGSSHLSQNSTIAHFGLGTAAVVDSIIATWSGGKEQILLRQPVNTLLTIEESEDGGRSSTSPAYLLGALAVLAVAGLFGWRRRRQSGISN
jgi:enediyne biosynthesis protein E4